MNAHVVFVRRTALAVLACATLLAAADARAACTRVTLYPDEQRTFSDTPTLATMSGAAMTSNWVVVGLTPAAGEDWDLGLYQSAGTGSTCGTTLLASSNWGGQSSDFIVGDGTTNPHADVYAQFSRYSGTQSVHLSWTSSPHSVSVNGPLSYGSMQYYYAPRAFTCTLSGGMTYRILFTNWSAPGLRLHVFRNPGTGTYWTGRSGAIVTLSGATDWTPPASGNYLFVLTNDAHENGSYMFGIGRCPTPVALTSDVVATTTHAYDLWSFNQTSAYWAAVAVRSPDDYDLKVARSLAGPGYFFCMSDTVMASRELDATDVIVGDFNHSPTGTYYVETNGLVGGTQATVEYEGGAQTITVGAAPVMYATGPGNVIRTWDIALTAGQAYNFHLAGPSTTKLLLFRNPGSSTYYAQRSDAVFEISGCTNWTAPATDFYGLVVLNDGGVTGTYSLGVNQAPCPCPTTLANGVPVSPVAPDGYYADTTSTASWAVMAVRGQTSADDWDLSVFGWPTGSASPTCFGNSLAGSGYSAGAVDLVAMDFNASTEKQTRWARAHHSGGAGTAGRAEWRISGSPLVENDPWLSVHLGAQDLVRVFDANMTAGVAYTIEFDNPGGVTALVFQNPGAGAWLGSRASVAATGTTTFTYTPTRSGDHAIVLANDGIVDATVSIRYGRCTTPTPLANRTASTTTGGVVTRSFTAPNPNWLAVGVLSGDDDWDMSVGAGTGTAWPSCVTSTLASSQSTNTRFVDFVVADQHHTTTGGTFYLDAHQFSPAPLWNRPLWLDQGGSSLVTNQYDATPVSVEAGEMFKVFDLALVGGLTYTFALTPYGLTLSGARLLLYRNPGSGAFWASRAAAVLDLPLGSGRATYTAPATDVYGLVLVNDSYGSDAGTVLVGVHTCPEPTALTSGVPQTGGPNSFHAFTPSAPFWTAVGVRSTASWALEVDSLGSGGVPGMCFTGTKARSGTPPGAAVVVGDFNAGANAYRTWYLHAYGYDTNPPPGIVQWSGGTQSLGLNDIPTARSVATDFVLEVWDVYLQANTLCGVNLSSTGATFQALVFGNPGGVYWAPRTSSLFATSGSGTFTAPRTGWYAVVVVKDSEGAGTFRIGVTSGVLATEAAPPAKTMLRAIAPNPARGALTVEYALHAAAAVRLELLDTAGRLVATIEDGARPAGTWRVPFTSAASAGALPPGLYLVRLRADGRTVGERKVALIR